MEKPPVQFLAHDGMKGLPFSEAVRVGDMLYLSGQLGIDFKKAPQTGSCIAAAEPIGA